MQDIQAIPWPDGSNILVLAPHPDDFDSIAVTLRFFYIRKHPLRLTVVSSSPAGVQDSFCSPPTPEVKAATREREQLESCALFGLAEKDVTFLRLADGTEDVEAVGAQFRATRPGLVFLPHGNDTNAGHRATWAMFRQLHAQADWPVTGLLNRDPKTIAMRHDAYMAFAEDEAHWKASLLRCHRSQQQRNLGTRGYGFDERILRMNREDAAALPGSLAYAEVFEIWR